MVLPHPLDSYQDFKLQQGLSRVKLSLISNEIGVVQGGMAVDKLSLISNLAAALFPLKLNEQKKLGLQVISEQLFQNKH